VLLAGGMSNVTVRDVDLAAVKATLQYAVDQGIVSEDPAAGMKVRVKGARHAREKGFEQNEATTILAVGGPSASCDNSTSATRGCTRKRPRLRQRRSARPSISWMSGR
jgi:hypothetical protein